MKKTVIVKGERLKVEFEYRVIDKLVSCQKANDGISRGMASGRNLLPRSRCHYRRCRISERSTLAYQWRQVFGTVLLQRTFL